MNDPRRRSKRRNPDHVIHVTNAMTGGSVGRIGNLSIDGLMVIGNTPLHDDALYQFSFQLPDDAGKPHTVELGVHEQWGETAASGQHWAGFRIIDISSQDYDLVDRWIETGSED